MANDDDIFKKIDDEANEFDTFIDTQETRIAALPPEEQDKAYETLDQATSRGDSILNQKYDIAEQGGEIPEDLRIFPKKEKGEGVWQWLLGSFSKLGSAAPLAAEALLPSTQEKPGESARLFKEAGKSLIPFYETVTGDKTERRIFSDVLEKAGVSELGSLSELIPATYSETGEEWLKFKKDGLLDFTGRGTLGFGLDVLGDPTNILLLGPVRRGAQGLLQGVNKVAGGAIGKALPKRLGVKTLRDLAVVTPGVKTLVRGFDKLSFLSRNVKHQAGAEKALRKYLDDGGRITGEEVDRVVKLFEDIKVFKDKKVFDSLSKLDDITRLHEAGKLDEIAKLMPDKLEVIVKNGKVNSDAFLDVLVAEERLTAKQMAAAQKVRQFLDGEGALKLQELGLIEKHMLHNYMPRKLVDMSILDDLSDTALDALRRENPEALAQIERLVLSKEHAKTLGLEGATINNALRASTMAPARADKLRVFSNFQDAANHAKILGGRIERNIPKLLAETAISRRKKVALLQLEKDLGEVFGSRLPKEVVDTLRQIGIGKSPLPEILQKASKMWNKHFLNRVKYGLTFPFPAYHLRNIMDDTFRGYEKLGVKWLNPFASRSAGHILSQGDKMIDLGQGMSMHASELYQHFVNMGIVKSSFLRADLNKKILDVSKRIATAKSPLRAMIKKATDFLPVSETFALKMNNHARIKGGLISLVDELKKKKITKLSGEGFENALLKAAKDSKDAFIDLADLGPIDDLLAQVIPFYRFTRKNVPFQIKTILTQPQRISKLGVVRNNMRTDQLSDEDQAALSPYIRDNLTLSLGDNLNGNTSLLAGTGLSIEELNRFFNTQSLPDTIRQLTIGQSAPPLQFLYTYISNKHPFFGSELDSYRGKKTYRIFHDNKSLNKLVGGVSRIATKKVDGKIQYKYELDDPKQYYKTMMIYSPIISAGASAIPGLGGILSGVVSPRGIDAFAKATNDKPEFDSQFMLNLAKQTVSPMKVREYDFDQLKMFSLLRDMSEAYKGLKSEERRLSALYEIGGDLSGDDEDDEWNTD